MFRKSVWIPILIVLLAVMGCGLFYSSRVGKQEPAKVYKPVKVENPATPKPKPPGETAESGHWHGDEWHAQPHDLPAQPTQTPTPQRATQGGYWQNGVYYRPPGYVPPYPQGQTSLNPLFADGVPGHLKCPQKWIGVYLWATDEYEAVREKMGHIALEVLEKYNPNRPIRDIWTQFIEAEKFYQTNADMPPLDPERDNSGAALERYEGVGRTDWIIQHVLDYPEIIQIQSEQGDSAVYTNAWRVELGFDHPNWNLVTLPDGRQFRERSGYYYEFTYTIWVDGGKDTYTYRGGHSGKDATLVRVNLNETSDEELRALSAPDFREALYNWEGK